MKRKRNEYLEQGNGSRTFSQGGIRKKRGAVTYILKMLGGIVVLAGVMSLGAALYVWVQEGKNDSVPAGSPAVEITYTQKELDELLSEAGTQAGQAAAAAEAERILGGIEAGLAEGNTVVETLRPFYPEDIVVVSGGKFHFIPIRDDLKKHSLLQENLSLLENGEYQYLENGLVMSHKGIDVSYHQGDIDWTSVALTDVEYVFIRVGYRGYGSGKMVLDEQFENNIQGAAEAGLKVGVYFFSQAVSEEEVLEEANFVLEQIAPYQVDFPVVFDVEKVTDSTARMNRLTVEVRTSLAILFCEAVKEAGYTPMIYHNMEMGALLLDLTRLEAYEKWFAYYGTDFYYPYAYQIWQYSEKGYIEGISGEVDMNISFKIW